MVSGVLAAIGAGSLGLLACLSVVVLGWATDPNSTGSAPGLIRTAGDLWLLAHRAPLTAGGHPLALAPLALSALLFAFVARAAAGSLRRRRVRGRKDSLVAALAVAPPYALVLAVVAGATRTAQLSASPLAALGFGFVFAVLGALVGAARFVGWEELTKGWPQPARAVPVAAAAVAAVLLATGALLVAASLAVDARAASSIARSVEGAGPAGFALLVAQVALAPNAAIWGSAYAVGSGFSVGVGTHVGPAGAALGAVPGLPLLAALPASGPAPALAWVSLVGVLAAGVAGGVVLGRRLVGPQLQFAGAWMVAVAVAAAGVFALLCWLAGGSGPGRLAVLGPQPLASAAAVAQWVALSGVPAAWFTAARRARAGDS